MTDAASLQALRTWAHFAEEHWSWHAPGVGYFGTGYHAWGVQTNQKYLAAMAVLTNAGGPAQEWALDRARAALRFSLTSHISGDGQCADGSQWGHTWISALGIERMMHGVDVIWPYLSDSDLDSLRRVLCSEADWLLTSHQRGENTGVFGSRWNASGRNAPESNLWNGALLWRAASVYPSHSRAQRWRKRAVEFLVNGVSIPADEWSDEVVDGMLVRDLFRGANFFPNLALDHHGYLNVGYLVICASHAAILHFDLRRAGLPTPQALHRHQAELWRVIKQMTFADGRLARIGGDSRVRYAYCQEYLMPVLLYAADQFGDAHALDLLDAQLRLIATEQEASGDGSFYGNRLAELARSSPYYYTRLESDRAVALGMVTAYRPQVRDAAPPAVGLEESVRGSWSEPEHGAVLHRSPRRLASFAWRGYGLAQGMCLPPGDGHLAEWALNLSPEVRVAGDAWAGGIPSRRLMAERTEQFAGGFVTCGSVVEGAQLRLDEGWTGGDAAVTWIALAALPDDRTMVGLHLCRSSSWPIYLQSVKGLHLNVPNDLFNGYTRRFAGSFGELALSSPSSADGPVGLDSRWATVDDRLGVIGIHGGDGLIVHRRYAPRGGRYGSLRVEELCFPFLDGPRLVQPDTTFVDIGWALLSGAGREETASVAAEATAERSDAADLVRSVEITGADRRRYRLIANLGNRSTTLPTGGARVMDLVSRSSYATEVPLPASSATVLRIE